MSDAPKEGYIALQVHFVDGLQSGFPRIVISLVFTSELTHWKPISLPSRGVNYGCGGLFLKCLD
jgi:hypothetical protein